MIIMCNGDLGMYRVMPWAYPTIPGQSSGGTSVDPIPEPEPGMNPYDVSGMVVSVKNRTTTVNKTTNYRYATFKVMVQGVKLNDVTNVSYLRFSVTDPNGISVSPNTIGGDSNPEIIYDSGKLGTNNPNTWWAAVIFHWNNATSGEGTNVSLSGNFRLTIYAYDSSGNLLQSFTGVTTS